MKLISKFFLSVCACACATVLWAGDDTVTPNQNESLQALRAVAESDGIVRVIVSLASPEDLAEITPGATVESTKTLMQTLLPSADAPLVDPIEDQPLVVMEVTTAGLEFLSTSPLVARIEADGLTGIPPLVPDARDDDEDAGPSFGGQGSGDLAAPQAD